MPTSLTARKQMLPVQVNLPIDVFVMPKQAQKGDLPLLIEAKSAGDFTNVNKRRIESGAKMDTAPIRF